MHDDKSVSVYRMRRVIFRYLQNRKLRRFYFFFQTAYSVTLSVKVSVFPLLYSAAVAVFVVAQPRK